MGLEIAAHAPERDNAAPRI